ncbi:unnamed protein product [Microthlaspi erraticum]|uniref:Uncharacterized protein n=1 Tax=Microthlaspi erraticum TaxID=1685480 RepID=A0A6D2L2Z6_9BRAS|nr:unnamed protein product [Microthlaspi erraticum]
MEISYLDKQRDMKIVPPKELGGKVVVWRWQTAIRTLHSLCSLDRACSWLDRVVPRVVAFLPKNLFLQDLAKKNADKIDMGIPPK